ncbi:MAG: DinB family protein [Deinococcota bacterium]
MAKTHEQLTAELAQFNTDTQTLLALSDVQLLQRPPSGKWSVAEHFMHLVATNNDYFTKISDALAAQPDKQAEGPYNLGVLGRMFAWGMEPPIRLKMPTADMWKPPADLKPAQVREDFLTMLDTFTASLESARGAALDKIIISSPVSERVRLSLVEAYCVLLAHGRRHVWLGNQVIDTLTTSAETMAT